ncbi:MAG: molybdate ABC transporter substrate-binding protein [Pirellulales bacterium]|nr:molybdate ABC transporter substrate-binding protein [Pirellulales bacterium]
MAKRSVRNRSEGSLTEDWSVGVRVSVDRRGQTILDQQVADLLAALDRAGSINAAAKKVKTSYRHAWLMLNQANANAEAPLFEATVGGSRGGGTRLTDHGRNALAVFQQVQRQAGSAAAKALTRIVRSTLQQSAVVHVAAAISLQEALAQALTEYALLRPSTDVRTMFGASNELADQIIAGAAVDLFASANERHVARLAKAGLIDPKSRRRLASNTLAVVGLKELVGVVNKPADLRAQCESTIVVASPNCPLGECTAAFLASAGLSRPLKSRLQTVESSRAVVASLRADRSRLGIVFESDLHNLTGLQTLFAIDASKAKTNYEGAIVANSSVAGDAKALLDFLQSPAAQACFRRCGFVA